MSKPSFFISELEECEKGGGTSDGSNADLAGHASAAPQEALPRTSAGLPSKGVKQGALRSLAGKAEEMRTNRGGARK